MSIKDQQSGGPSHRAHDQQGGRRPAPRSRAATGLAAGSTMFARMPSYTPVTRAPEQAYPQDPGYDTQPVPEDYTYDESAQGGAYQGHHPDQQNYGDPQAYSGQNAYPAQDGYAQDGYAQDGDQLAGYSEGYDEQAYAEQSYDEHARGEQAYGDQGYGNEAYAGQPYQDAGYSEGEGSEAAYQPGAYQDSAYHDGTYQDATAEEEPLDLGLDDGSGYADKPAVQQSFEAYGDGPASYAGQPPAQGYDAYAPAEGQEHGEEYGPEHGQAYGQQHGPDYDQGYGQAQDYGQAHDPAAFGNGQAYDEGAYADPAFGGQPHDAAQYTGEAYDEAPYPNGGYAPQEGAHAVQPYEAAYDHAPEVPLYDQPAADGHMAESEGDADFMAAQPDADGKKAGAGLFSRPLGRRNTMMLGGAVLGAIALGGALAFAYKQTGGGLAGGEPPLITAENTPVKEAPEQPGGKEFPHKNKLIYDRLVNGDQPEADRLVPRQEELALPNMPAQTDMPDMPELAAAEGAGSAAAGPDSGPRKVKTLTVRPDGSVDGAEPSASAEAGDGAQAEPTTTASIEPQAEPEAAPASQPAPEAAVNRQYVVQVASKRDQTEALAAFADMQQKYPSLLSNYRPMVQRVNLGDKGVWYRLQVGPMNSQTDASQLCGQLKAQGLSECLVMAQ